VYLPTQSRSVAPLNETPVSLHIIDEKISPDDSATAKKHLAKRWKPQNPDAGEIQGANLQLCAWGRLAIGDTFAVEWPIRCK
jgi:hypothetical protein